MEGVLVNTGTRFIHRTNTGWCVVKVFTEGQFLRVIAIAHYDGPGSKRQAVTRAGTNTELPREWIHGNVKVSDLHGEIECNGFEDALMGDDDLSIDLSGVKAVTS